MNEATVLLVEDNRLLREWISSSLEDDGFRVVAPESVSEALRLAAVHPFDLVVTDWRLRDGYDGFDVLAQVRKQFPQTVSVLISSDVDPQLAERARNAGFNAVLEKPFPPWKIAAALHALLQRQGVEAG